MKVNLIKTLDIYKVSFVISLVAGLFLLAKTTIPSTKISPYASLSFSILLEEQSKNILAQVKTTELLKGEKIKGTFKASEDNLGIVLVRFVNTNKNNKPPPDLVVFRIKEIKQDKWYYEYAYKIDQFQPHQYFTFGFPKIYTSKNKTFTFEIESIAGKKDAATALSHKTPQVALAYQFSRNELLADKTVLLRFIFKKFLYALFHINLLLFAIVYAVVFILLWLLKKWNTVGADRFYKIAKRLFKRAIYLLRLLLFFIVPFIVRLFNVSWYTLTTFGKRLHRVLSLLLRYFLLKHKKSFPRFHILLIFLVAFLLRFSFYLNPTNFNDFIFSQIGGFGDYDMLIRHTLRYMEEKTLNTYFWSFLDDYFIQVRLFDLFFSLFGFIKGLDYLVYFSITLSSLVCLLPFVLSTRLTKFYLGGFVASLFLAINPTLIWISSSRILDVLTLFFLSLFILLFIISLKKKNFILVLLLGLIGLISGFNRGVMALATFPTLLLFGGYYLFSNKTLKWQSAIFAFTPFLLFLFFYALWAAYYQIIFSVPWIYSPQMVAHLFSYTAPVSVAGSSSLLNFILGHIILYILVIIQFMTLSFFPITLLVGIIVISLLYMKKPFRQKLIIAILPLAVTLFIIFVLQNLLSILKIDLKEFPWRYFTAKQISFSQYIRAGLFVEFIVVQYILTGREFLRYLIIILPYFVLIGYSYLKTFSDRHFSQLLVVFFILIAIALDRIFSRFSFKKSIFMSLVLLFYVIMLFSFILQKSYEGLRDIVTYGINAQKEIAYLKFVDSVLPSDAIILAGAKNGENLIWLSKFAKRDLVYNVNNPPLVMIPHGPQLPKIAMRAIYPIFHRYDVVDLPSNNPIEKIFNDRKNFSRYNFFALDYNNTEIGSMISSQYGNEYILIKFVEENGRKIYKLVKI